MNETAQDVWLEKLGPMTKGTSALKLSSSTVRIFFWGMAAFFGIFQTWSNRFTVANFDIIPYTDMANYILKGQWDMAVSGHWSPFFPCLLAMTMAIFRPSVYWEYPTVHLLLFC